MDNGQQRDASSQMLEVCEDCGGLMSAVTLRVVSIHDHISVLRDEAISLHLDEAGKTRDGE